MGWGRESETVNSMVKVGFLKVTFGPKFERSKEPSQVGRTFLPGRRNSRCKGPERMSLGCLRGKEVSVTEQDE